jgi:hypothetical protein
VHAKTVSSVPIDLVCWPRPIKTLFEYACAEESLGGLNSTSPHVCRV